MQSNDSETPKLKSKVEESFLDQSGYIYKHMDHGKLKNIYVL